MGTFWGNEEQAIKKSEVTQEKVVVPLLKRSKALVVDAVLMSPAHLAGTVSGVLKDLPKTSSVKYCAAA